MKYEKRHDEYCHCPKCQQSRTVETLLHPNVNLIRHLDGRLTAQLPMWASTSMNTIAKDLIKRLDGNEGLYYTAEFKWLQVGEVEEFFNDLNYEVVHIDKREDDRKLKKLLGE
jgi:hypothetical protein